MKFQLYLFYLYSIQIPDVLGNRQNEYRKQNNRLKIQNSSSDDLKKINVENFDINQMLKLLMNKSYS